MTMTREAGIIVIAIVLIPLVIMLVCMVVWHIRDWRRRPKR